MTLTTATRTARLTGPRVAVLVVVWLAFVYVMAPSLGLYYELLAVWYTLPSLGLVYAYCLSYRSRSTAILAAVATIIVVLLLGSPLYSRRGPRA